MTNIQLIDGKRYVVLECEFASEWQVGRECRKNRDL